MKKGHLIILIVAIVTALVISFLLISQQAATDLGWIELESWSFGSEQGGSHE